MRQYKSTAVGLYQSQETTAFAMKYGITCLELRYHCDTIACRETAEGICDVLDLLDSLDTVQLEQIDVRLAAEQDSHKDQDLHSNKVEQSTEIPETGNPRPPGNLLSEASAYSPL